ncbi:MAG: hypothetical protein ABIH18_05195 [Candidatus Omnitrophota bacterium]
MSRKKLKLYAGLFNPSTEIFGFKTGDECCIVFSAQEEAPGFSPGSFTLDLRSLYAYSGSTA